MTIHVCPCTRVVERVNDGREGEVMVECPECVANHGVYSKSSAWPPEPKPEPIAPSRRWDSGSLDADNILPFPKAVKGPKAGKKKAGGGNK